MEKDTYYKDKSISISFGTIITLLLVIVGGYTLWLLRDLALLVITAIVIASAIEPGITPLVKRRVPRFVAALLLYTSVFGSIFLFAYFFFPPIVTDATRLLSENSPYLDVFNKSELFKIAPLNSPTAFINQIESFVGTLFSLKSSLATASGSALTLLSTFFGGIFSFVLVIVLSFYFALQDTGVDDFLRMIMPIKYEEYSVDLWKRSQKKIGLWMQGQILLSVIVGILIFLGLLIIDVPYALLLAVFTAATGIIPVFGSLLAGVLAVAVGYSSGGIAIASIVAGLYIVVNQFESNLIYPLIVKKIVGIPPLLVIIALIAGYTLSGFLGVLLSVPIAGVILELLSDFDKHKRRVVKATY